MKYGVFLIGEQPGKIHALEERLHSSQPAVGCNALLANGLCQASSERQFLLICV